MAYKFISLLVVSCILANTQGASTKNSINGERIAALYVKDSSNGELRFLGGGIGGNSNAQLNQLITQKQDMLEQLRPTSTSAGWGSGTGSGSFTGTGSGTGSGSFTSGLSSGGVTPIIVNAGGSSTSATNSGTSGDPVLNAAINASPIGNILPNIIAQAVSTRRGPNANNRRRVVNNQRRRNNRRRPGRRGNKKGNKNAQIYVIRPKA